MGFFSFLSGRNKDVLTSVFDIAEKGMYKINFPISKEGQFEVMMFDIWIGTIIIEGENIKVDYESMRKRIEEQLKQTALKLGLPTEKKYERMYLFRKEGWKHDVMGLAHSDYPRTKQFLPAYTYLCMKAKPLSLFDEDTTKKEMDKIPSSGLVDFLGPFCEHYLWLVEALTKSIKR